MLMTITRCNTFPVKLKTDTYTYDESFVKLKRHIDTFSDKIITNFYVDSMDIYFLSYSVAIISQLAING